MPSFLFPAFLVGAAAAAIPVLLHLLRNRQAPEIRFSAIRLLQGMRVEQASRRRVHDRLLLALRVAALCLLAIAFARPYFVWKGTRTSDATTVIAVDRSASMSAAGVWSRAMDAAGRAVSDAPRGARVGLVAFDTRADVIVEPTFDRATVKAAIDRLRPTNRSTLFRAGIARAVSALGGAGRIVVISDLQGAPTDVNTTIGDSVRMDVRAVGGPWSNLAVLALRRDDKGLVATIRNDGNGPQRATAIASVDGKQVDRRETDLAPGEALEVPFRVNVAGGSAGEVALAGHDVFAGDDRRYIALDSNSQTRVLVAGERGGADAFYLLAALNAAAQSPEFETQAIGTDHVAERLSAWRPDVLAILSPRGLGKADTDAVATWIEAGGGLLVAVGADADDHVLAPLVAGLRFAAERSSDEAVSFGQFESRHPLFEQLGGMTDSLASAHFARAWRVDARGWNTIARFGDGRGAMFERARGRGRVLVLASDLDRAWNDLPLQLSFVPFMQGIARYLAPARDRGELTPDTAPDALAAHLGVAQLASGRHAAINLDPRESDPARMTADAFNAGVRRTASPAVTDLRARARSEEAGQAFWRYGLVLMLVALLADALLASPARRAGRRAA